PKKPVSPPTVSVAGTWLAELQYAAGSSQHTLEIQNQGNAINGIHRGSRLTGKLSGSIVGDRVAFRSTLPYVENIDLNYDFTGRASEDRMSGEVDMGEYGHATWTAHRQS